MLITRKSSFTGIVHTMDLPVTQEQIDAWKSGVLIQNAFPNLSIADKEFLKSGCTQQEWDEAMGSEDDE